MSDKLENHVFDRSEYVMLSSNGPMVDRLTAANAKIAELEFALNVEKAFTETQGKQIAELIQNSESQTQTADALVKKCRELEADNARLLSAANYMLDTLDAVQFRDAANMRLHEYHPAYEKLQAASNAGVEE